MPSRDEKIANIQRLETISRIKELEIMANAPKQSFAEKAMGDAVSSITEPIQKTFEKVDAYTGAPVRAAVGAAQRGGSLSDIGKAAGTQLLAGEVLPSTPSQEEVVYTEQVKRGVNPEFAKKSSEVLGPVAGAVMDLSQFAPSGTMIKLGGKALKGASTISKGIADGVNLLGRLGKKGTLGIGQVLTLGALDANKAFKATENLSGAKLLFPGNMKIGPMKGAATKLGEARTALRENQVTVPGSLEAVLNVRNEISKASQNTVSSPGANALLDLIDRKVAPLFNENMVNGPTDLSISDLDDIIGNLDVTLFTGQGNPKALNRFWKPVLNKSRAQLDQAIQTVPEGEMFKSLKSNVEDLATAGKNRSKLLETASLSGVVAAAAFLEPTALLSRFLSPVTYMQIIGAAKLPKDAVKATTALLLKAKESGKIGEISKALQTVAKEHPESAERIVRSILLASGKETDLGEDPEAQLKAKGIQTPSSQTGLQLPGSR